jgi:hypothetical protein
MLSRKQEEAKNLLQFFSGTHERNFKNFNRLFKLLGFPNLMWTENKGAIILTGY